MSPDSSAGGEQVPVDYDPFAGVVLERVVPTTEPQREVWLADRMGREASLAYNESITIRLAGPLDLGALRAALLDLIQRHDALRSTFGANGEELCIAKQAVLDLAEEDHSEVDESIRQDAIAAAKLRAVTKPFVLETGPLFRALILKLDRAEHLLLLTAHHVVCDGWSFGVLVRDLVALYEARVGQEPKELAAAPSFGDYAVAQDARLAGEQANADEAYWLGVLRGPLPILDLPVDYARGAWRTFDSRREDYTLPADVVAQLRKLGGQSGSGLFATLLGLFTALLQRISGGEDLVVGIPAAGQSLDGLDGLVGHCVNLLPLRLQLDSSDSVGAALRATQSAVLDAYEHQTYTMGSLLKKLAVPRDPSRPTLISVLFNVDSEIDIRHNCPGLSVAIASNPRQYEIFELFVNAVHVEDELRLECQYNASLFDAATIRGWLRCYEALLRSACAAQDTAISTLAFASSDDRELLRQWNDTRREYAAGSRVHELFEAQVARTPSQAALKWRDTTMTYAQLEGRANQLARALQALGVQPGDLVGLYLERSPDLVAAMLGVMKAGAAYVPLDPAFPRERLTFMAGDASLAAVVADESVAQDLLPRERSLLLDVDAANIAAQSQAPLALAANGQGPDELAYVIYTSGSTGKPNGVCVPHRAVVNFLESMTREPGLAPGDRLLAVTTPSFDIAVTELLLPLTVGATIVLATRDEATDGARLARLIESSAATTMQATPATWRLLLAAGWVGDKQFKALCGGEELTVALAEQLLARVGQLWNMYGPTETTVWSSVAHITDAAAGVSIGRPLANTCIWILDKHQSLCPVGVPGEIWIGGDGVTQGYLRRPELTAARFLPDPRSDTPGAMMYRTGDRGRWRASGLLQHLGRLDFQVKVRGYRIELGEIEARLVAHPGIEASVAVVREDRPGDVRLVAYYVAKTAGAPAVEELRAHLSEVLPNYMVPQFLVPLPELPQLPNGKLHRSALPAPEARRQQLLDYQAPRNATEQGVAEEMEAVLGMQGIGVDDDFFVLGGHSLLAAHLTYRLNSRFELSLSIRSVFEGPTVAQLAAAVDKHQVAPTTPRQPIMRLADQSRAPASFMQERLWLLESMNPGRVAYHAPSAHRLVGALDAVAFDRAFREVVRRQPSLRTCFESHRHGLEQCVLNDVQIALFPAEDLRTLPREMREQQLKQRLYELTAQTFDLTRAPLFRVRMFQLDEAEHVFFFMPHHIIWDGWSFDLLYQEMSRLYEAYRSGGDSPLPALERTYCDFAAWHRNWMRSADCQQQLAFWSERMLQAGTPRPLPTDKPRPPSMSGDGSTEWITIAKDKSAALHGVAAQAGATQFVATLTVYCVLLHDFARESLFVVGTPVRARMVAEVEAIMGYFNNLLLLPVAIDPGESFLALLERVRAAVIESFAVPEVPLELLERALTDANRKSTQALYQALFSFQDVRQRATQWGDLRHSMIPLFQQGATEDLGLWFVESAEGMQGGLTYNTDVFEAATAKWLVQRYLFLLERVLANPAASVAELVGTVPPPVAQRLVARDALQVSAQQRPRDRVIDAALRPKYQAPASDLETRLAMTWQQVLGVDKVGRTDNFFDLGGTSLGVLNMIAAVERSVGIRIDAGALARTPTIAGLVVSLASPAAVRETQLVVLRRGGHRKLFLVHDGEGSTLPYLNLARHLPADVSVYGIEPPSHPRVPLVITSIEAMASRYLQHVRRCQPHGPYLLGGLCAGGLIAYEMAVQLERSGEQVDLLAILDAGTPQAAVKPGLQSDLRKKRFRRALAEVHASGGSATKRFWRLSTTLVDRVFGALSWAVTSRLRRLSAWARVVWLRRVLRSEGQWPTWLSSLTFHQIYVYAEVRYVPEKLLGTRVVLIRPRAGGALDPAETGPAVDDTPYVEIYAEADLGWRRLVDQLTVIDVDGGHSSMLWEPHVVSLAGSLSPFVAGETSSRSNDAVSALGS